MATEISCPSCNMRLNLPEEYIGQTVKCPTCETQFVAEMPAATTESPAPPAPPPPVPTAPPPSYQPPPSTPGPDHTLDDDYTRRSLRTPEKPGNVQAVNVLLLIGGITALLMSVVYAGGSGLFTMGCGCIWPGWIYAIVAGILAIVKASKLMGENGHLEQAPSNAAILLIVCIVNMDVVTCVLGIIALVLLNDPKTREYYRG